MTIIPKSEHRCIDFEIAKLKLEELRNITMFGLREACLVEAERYIKKAIDTETGENLNLAKKLSAKIRLESARVILENHHNIETFGEREASLERGTSHCNSAIINGDSILANDARFLRAELYLKNARLQWEHMSELDTVNKKKHV